MRQWFRYFGLSFSLALVAYSFGDAQECAAQLRINEILADPASDWNGDTQVDFKSDEWVEIVNIGDVSVDLSDYRLSDSSGDFRYGFTGLLHPGQQRLVLGSDSVAWETAEGASTVGLSLNNGGDTVQLLRVDPTQTVVVDSYTYPSHTVVDDRSVGRMPDGDGTWLVFDALNPYSGSDLPESSGCAPTPGFGNDCPTAVEGESWSKIKQLFANEPN